MWEHLEIFLLLAFGNKTITTGEGGMVVTNDKTLYDRCLHFKGQGLAVHRQYWHDVIGYNYRMTNICAAIGLAQLEQADDFISRKREIADIYKKISTVLYKSTRKVKMFFTLIDGLNSN